MNQFWNTYKVKTLEQYCNDCGSKLWMCAAFASSITPSIVPSTTISSSSSITNDSILVAVLVLCIVILITLLLSALRTIKHFNASSVVSCGKPTHESIPMNVV